jgi:branched-chain amino acid transport system permease protein
MELLIAIFFTPFAEMWEGPVFFAEVVLNGLLTGVMYSLVALGFVLIFKASEIFNFAQGVMVLFAALSLVGLMELGVPAWIAVILTLGIMVVLALVIERVMLRPLVNQDPFILFMSTIGLTFFLEGFGETLWGSNVKRLDIGIPEDVIEYQGILLSQFDIIAAVVGAVLVFGLAIFFTKTPIGRALRAVADDHQAALSVGIPLKNIWAVVWAASAIVALFAGLMWGSKLGVQFSISLLAFKALPVILIGGFTSIPGAIVGGLIVGSTEKLFEVYVGIPYFGGGTENWSPYMLGTLFLLVWPQGLFGEKIIERV